MPEPDCVLASVRRRESAISSFTLKEACLLSQFDFVPSAFSRRPLLRCCRLSWSVVESNNARTKEGKSQKSKQPKQ